MVLPDLPIDIMRIVSLNRLRKFRRLFDYTVRCEEMPRLDAAAKMSSSDQLRSIRKRAGKVEEPSSADSHARMEHLAGIRTAIAEGRYHVSAADLAQKLIDHMVANRLPKV
jgi:anti-sigma28 factor (negative regulator of flagellin synthesis)